VKRLLIGALLCSAVFLSGCKCAVEKTAVDQVENSHNLISVQLLKYVEADAKLDAKAKDDWKKLVESDKANIQALKHGVER
jgi:chaperone required for assembly of F1-ATPase